MNNSESITGFNSQLNTAVVSRIKVWKLGMNQILKKVVRAMAADLGQQNKLTKTSLPLGLSATKVKTISETQARTLIL